MKALGDYIKFSKPSHDQMYLEAREKIENNYKEFIREFRHIFNKKGGNIFVVLSGKHEGCLYGYTKGEQEIPNPSNYQEIPF